MNKTINSKTKNVYNKSKKVVVFYNRIILFSLLIFLCITLSIVFLYNAFSINSQKHVTYQEKSNINYKVFLKKNNFYEKPYLEKNMVYVASLINTIDVYFDYLFTIDDASDIDFDYDITGNLVIMDNNEQKTFFNKKYNLMKKETGQISDGKTYSISKRITIDYDYYNDLANKFKSNYGVDTTSNLVVKLKVHQKGKETNEFKLNSDSNMSIIIPLSERAVNIKMNYKEVNKKSQILKSKSFGIKNYTFLIVGLIFSFIATISVIIFVRLILIINSKKSAYDKFVDKILKEYDRLIVETKTPPILKKKHIVEILEFDELLDVRDNLNLPIKYYIISKHKECSFYIDHEEEIYIMVVDARKLEEEKIEK